LGKIRTRDFFVPRKEVEVFRKLATAYMIARELADVCVELAKVNPRTKEEFERQAEAFRSLAKVVFREISNFMEEKKR